jgi:serine/threonine protein kinase/tetratricopeptide (TPR) repeat protein
MDESLGTPCPLVHCAEVSLIHEHLIWFADAISMNYAGAWEQGGDRHFGIVHAESTHVTMPSPIEDIFLLALQKGSLEERSAFLDQACCGDTELRDQLERLLSAHMKAGASGGLGGQPTVINLPPGARFTSEAATVCAGGTVTSEIGPYRLVQKLGEGGMGTVYIAEQDQPVKRRVALKVITAGVDSERVMRRFQSERQVLALMEHPNIARILDAGMTEADRPYFAMELVKGAPITRHCDEHRLSIPERLRLFVQVCQAIQHAHQKGIIHRDIKPSNVLVCVEDDKPVAKVIDFGVAKAVHYSTDLGGMATQYGALVGTFQYMAPEQADLTTVDIDTRADVYSLGVLLYQLLTGTTPLDRPRVPAPTFSEIVRMITLGESLKPSDQLTASNGALATLAAQRGTDPARLTSLVRGELDWITMKALDKDRTRRYQSASSFARDILRYLGHEPVEACPPSLTYRTRKYIQRHFVGVAASCACVVLLVSGTAISTWQAVRARAAERAALAARDAEIHQRRHAEQQLDRAQAAEALAKTESEKAKRSAAEAQAIMSYIQEQVLIAARSHQDGAVEKKASIQKAIDTAEKIAAAFSGQQAAEASVRAMLGETYRYLGESPRAIQQLERAVELRSAGLGPDHPDTLNSQNELAIAYREMGQFDKAIPLLERTLAAKRRVLGPEHVDTLDSQRALGVVYRSCGRLEEAISLYEQTLASQRRKLGPDFPDTLATQNTLAVAYRQSGRVDEAIALLEQSLSGFRAKLGPEHANTLNVQHNLAAAYLAAGRIAEATDLLERTRAAQMRNLGPNHPETLHTQNQLARAYLDGGQIEQSITLFESTLTARKSKLGPKHLDTLWTMHGLALAYARSALPERAEPLFQEVLEVRRAKLSPGHRDIAVTLDDFGRYLVHQHKYAEAEGLLRDCLASGEGCLRNNWIRFDAQSTLGAALLGQLKRNEAEAWLVQGYEGLKAHRSAIPLPMQYRLREAAQHLVEFYDAAGNKNEANRWRKQLNNLRVHDPARTEANAKTKNDG